MTGISGCRRRQEAGGRKKGTGRGEWRFRGWQCAAWNRGRLQASRPRIPMLDLKPGNPEPGTWNPKSLHPTPDPSLPPKLAALQPHSLTAFPLPPAPSLQSSYQLSVRKGEPAEGRKPGTRRPLCRTSGTYSLQPTAYSLQPTAYSLQPTAFAPSQFAALPSSVLRSPFSLCPLPPTASPQPPAFLDTMRLAAILAQAVQQQKLVDFSGNAKPGEGTCRILPETCAGLFGAWCATCA